jgi:hypothetical protein
MEGVKVGIKSSGGGTEGTEGVRVLSALYGGLLIWRCAGLMDFAT